MKSNPFTNDISQNQNDNRKRSLFSRIGSALSSFLPTNLLNQPIQVEENHHVDESKGTPCTSKRPKIDDTSRPRLNIPQSSFSVASSSSNTNMPKVPTPDEINLKRMNFSNIFSSTTIDDATRHSKTDNSFKGGTSILNNSLGTHSTNSSMYYKGKTRYGGSSLFYNVNANNNLVLRKDSSILIKENKLTNPTSSNSAYAMTSTARKILEELEKLNSSNISNSRNIFELNTQTSNNAVGLKSSQSRTYTPYSKSYQRFKDRQKLIGAPPTSGLMVAAVPSQARKHISVFNKGERPSNKESVAVKEGNLKYNFSLPILSNSEEHPVKVHISKVAERPNILLNADITNKVKQRWKCPTCLAYNNGERCTMCNYNSSNSSVLSAATNNKRELVKCVLGEIKASIYNKWTCDKCHKENDVGNAKCVACLTTVSHITVNPSSSLDNEGCICSKCFKACSSQGGVSVCSSCLQQQKETKDVDECEIQRKLAALKESASSKWSCTTCMIQNDDNQPNCVACNTPKVSRSNGPLNLNNKQTEERKWTCETCLVENKVDLTTCVCCSSSRDGSTANFKAIIASDSSLKSGFQFGVPSTDAVKSIAPPFMFGTQKKVEKKPLEEEKAAAVVVSFGVPSQEVNGITAPVFGEKISFSNIFNSDKAKPVDSVVKSQNSLFSFIKEDEVKKAPSFNHINNTVSFDKPSSSIVVSSAVAPFAFSALSTNSFNFSKQSQGNPFNFAVPAAPASLSSQTLSIPTKDNNNTSSIFNGFPQTNKQASNPFMNGISTNPIQTTPNLMNNINNNNFSSLIQNNTDNPFSMMRNNTVSSSSNNSSCVNPRLKKKAFRRT